MKKSFGLKTALFCAASILLGCSIDKVDPVMSSDCEGRCVTDRPVSEAECRSPMVWVHGRCLGDDGSMIDAERETCMSDNQTWVEGHCEISRNQCEKVNGRWFSLSMLDLGSGDYIRQIGRDEYLCGRYAQIISGTGSRPCRDREVEFFEHIIAAKKCSITAPRCHFDTAGDSGQRILMCSSCAPGSAKCEAGTGIYECSNLDNDPMHCGICGNRCRPSEVCKNGKCQLSEIKIGVCPEGTMDCGSRDDGSLLCIHPNDPKYCGAKCENGAFIKDERGEEQKGEVCTEGAVCDGARCVCSSSRLSCTVDGVLHCIDPMIDAGYCGANSAPGRTVEAADGRCRFDRPGKVCTPETHESGCSLGECLCAEGYVRCGDRCIDPDSDSEYCGVDRSCRGGQKCMMPSGCEDGKCVCDSGYIYCDGSCVDPHSDEYCGITDKCTDGVKCAGNLTCSAESGKCVCDEHRGYLQCGEDCIDPKTDPLHCGAESCTADGIGGEKCSGQNAVCVNGKCSNNCPAGEEICNGRCMIFNTNDNCGACGRKCEGELICRDIGNKEFACGCREKEKMCNWNGETICLTAEGLAERNLTISEDVCRCLPGYDDCDHKGYNGCETELYTNANCSSCDDVCGEKTEFHIYQSCIDKRCKNNICRENYGDCNQDMDSDGCETLLLNNNEHCGMCGRKCHAGYICEDGECRSVCPDGETQCGSVCVDIMSDVENCGGCGLVCRGKCRDGKCNKKELGTDVNNCGGLNNICKNLNDGEDQNRNCTGGLCACFRSNPGKRVNLNTDSAHCGTCDRKCGGDAVCEDGRCIKSGQFCFAVGEKFQEISVNCCTGRYESVGQSYSCVE